MIIGIGTDLIDIQRIETLLKKFGHRFERRIFTPQERRYARQVSVSAPRYAKRFAAKEAFFKALNTDAQQGFSWHDVEIMNLPSGQPIINVSSKVKNFLEQKYGNQTFTFHVSLTDTATLAQAFIIISKEIL